MADYSIATEERADTRSQAMEERADARSQALEETMHVQMSELVGIFGRWISDNYQQLKGKGVVGVKEALPMTTSRVSLKHVIPVTMPLKFTGGLGETNSWSARGLRSPLHIGQESKFPTPKSPKVEIPVFKGDEDVLNWLY